MHPLLQKIFETKSFATRDKQLIEVYSETSKPECELLQKIITDNKFSHSIEIGLAFGISALAITEAIVQNGGKHVVIDKFQSSDWKGAGLDLLSQAGYSAQIEFFEEYSYKILPTLLAEGRKFDFAYIDSTKLLDWLLVDFFFLDKLLQVNGVIAFDDASYPAIRKLLRYISQLPHYEIYDTYPANQKQTGKRKFLSLLKYLPKSRSFIKENITKTDFQLGINAHCVALRKTGDDKRDWYWFKEF
jgi:predicted O-methyltransferase YrrM